MKLTVLANVHYREASLPSNLYPDTFFLFLFIVMYRANAHLEAATLPSTVYRKAIVQLPEVITGGTAAAVQQ